MPVTVILRPNSNIVKSWNQSDFTYIDDDVTYPTKDGAGDYNYANKNDSNETEQFGLPLVDGTITDITIYMLVYAYDSSPSNLTATGNYSINGSSGVAGSWTIASQTTSLPSPASLYTWCSKTWSGLSLDGSKDNRILPGVGAMAQPKILSVAVAYLEVTYNPILKTNYTGGQYIGGNLQ